MKGLLISFILLSPFWVQIFAQYSGAISSPYPTFRLIKEYRVVSGASTGLPVYVTELVGAKDTIAVTGLDGNTDRVYKVMVDLVNPSTNDNPTIRINNLSTSVFDYYYAQVGAASTSSASATTSIVMFPSTGSNSLSKIEMTVYCYSGVNRQIIMYGSRGGASQNGFSALYNGAGNWRDTSTNLTSLVFRYSSISGGYGVGTIIRVFTLQQ